MILVCDVFQVKFGKGGEYAGVITASKPGERNC
jgi:hypothetical protein